MTIEERLEKIEQELAQLKENVNADKISAHKISLVDKLGEELATLEICEDSMHNEGPVLNLYSHKGDTSVRLAVIGGDAVLTLKDKGGINRVTLALKEGEPYMTLNDDNGEPIWSKP